MSDRKAAYIATVERIDDIEGKDAIKYIKLIDNGFQIIHNVVNTPINVGDKVVYIEYDTIIQPTEEFEFLRKRCWAEKRQAFHLKAMKMGGVVSYGLILTLPQAGRIFLSYGDTESCDTLLNGVDGTSLAEQLKIKPVDDAEEFEVKTQKIPPTKFQRFVKKYMYFIWKALYYRKPVSNQFPPSANKTDETRIENLQYVFNNTENLFVYITEKLDGQSFTASIFNDKFYIASRNLTKYCQPLKKAIKELNEFNEKRFGKMDEFVAIACRDNLPKVMAAFCKLKNIKHITMQAEFCGPGIQKNKMGFKSLGLYVYNLFDPITRRYHGWDGIADFAKHCDLDTVPLIERTLWRWKNTAELKEYSKGNYSNGAPREGIVIRTDVSGFNSMIPEPCKGMSNMWSMKCINPDFDAKYNC